MQFNISCIKLPSHTHIDLHGFNNCYNLCHLPISQCYYQLRTKWLPQVMRQSVGVRRLMRVNNFNTFIQFFFVIEPYQHS